MHVDDVLSVGPSEVTKNLLQELAKDMAMLWGVVTDKPQEFLGRSLCTDTARLLVWSFRVTT